MASFPIQGVLMSYGGYGGYVQLGKRPDPDEFLIAYFSVVPGEGRTLREAAEAVAAESSIGTWTSLSTMHKRVLSRLQAQVYKIHKNKKGGSLEVAYPIELFEEGNAPQILSDIAGNIFGMKEVASLRLEDFDAPRKYLETFPGPAFGREGVRRLVGTAAPSKRRPHLGTIVKPKVGLTPREGAKVAYDSWAGGLDFVKDDENLTSHPFSRFEDRLAHYLEARDRAQSETGHKKIYAPNITAPADLMLKRAELVRSSGGECVMIDIVTAGLSSVQFIRNQNLGVFIHAHRAMYAAFARSKKHGMSMRALAKLARLCGTDQLHIGAMLGKMEGAVPDVMQIHQDINGNGSEADPAHPRAVPGEPESSESRAWSRIKPVFSVCSGGLSPLQIPGLYKIIGDEAVFQCGGGVHGHPGGTRAGAMALVQSLEAAKKNIPLASYARTHPPLAVALSKWGRQKN
ncbi:MAG: ribulose-bisphosphate carboxylase large subunit [Candidatus Micrarchaeota archaeon]